METTERYKLNKELAQMLKGGVIMDVTTPEQAKIAEAAGACAVMALERIPADIRAAGGVSRMSDPQMIKGIQNAVSIPVMAKCRIGHFAEAQILQAIEIDYIDESEAVSWLSVLWETIWVSPSRTMLSWLMGIQISPFAALAMRLTFSVVANCPAQMRSPSFSRSGSSVTRMH